MTHDTYRYQWDRITLNEKLVYDDIGEREGPLLADALTRLAYWEQRDRAIVAELEQWKARQDVLLAALQAHQSVGVHVATCPRCGDGARCYTFNGLAKKADELTRSALAQIEEAQ